MCGLVLSPVRAFAISPIEYSIQKSLAGSFATASLLGDDEVIKFGIWDFDPNEFVDLDDENLGSEESTELRESLKQFNLPLHWRLSPEDADNTFWLMSKFAYLDVKQEQQIVPSPEPESDHIDNEVISAGIGLGYVKPLNAHWNLELEGYTTWMRYSNETDFNTTESQQIGPLLDEFATNFDVDVVMLEPIVGLNYNWSNKATRYRLFTNYHYLKGKATDAKIDAHEVSPEAWYWSNGFALKKPILSESWSGHSLWFRLARTDMGGDLDGQLGASYYYEAGVAWLVDTSDSFSFLSNIGVGINLNYGSDLRGGTLIFLYNFDEYR